MPDNCRVNLFVHFVGKQAETDSDVMFISILYIPNAKSYSKNIVAVAIFTC